MDYVKTIKKLADSEKRRQSQYLSLIASENFAYPEVLKISGSVLTNKYAEGYPYKRYYAGCKYIDDIERIGIEQLTNLFNCEYGNIQSYSGTIANFAIYSALLNLGDVILSMDLFSGGHLTHSSENSFVTKLYKVICYKVNPKNHKINYEQIKKLALKHKPKLIIAGGSSYSLSINFKKFREIADLVGAYLLADICHLSGLIIAEKHPHPFPHADVVMFTTHKQLRGPRGAVIAWNKEELTNKINKSVFPGIQGGPQPNLIAAKAICLNRANSKKYKEYIEDVCKYSKILAKELKNMGIKIIGNTTETHMLMIDVWKTFKTTGDVVEKWLEKSNILVNKNFIPNDKQKISKTSGIRIGTLGATVQGLNADDFKMVAEIISKVIGSYGDKKVISWAKNTIKNLVINRQKTSKYK